MVFPLWQIASLPLVSGPVFSITATHPKHEIIAMKMIVFVSKFIDASLHKFVVPSFLYLIPVSVIYNPLILLVTISYQLYYAQLYQVLSMHSSGKNRLYDIVLFEYRF